MADSAGSIRTLWPLRHLGPEMRWAIRKHVYALRAQRARAALRYGNQIRSLIMEHRG